jgi:hypothetical protein
MPYLCVVYPIYHVSQHLEYNCKIDIKSTSEVGLDYSIGLVLKLEIDELVN